MSGSQSQSWSQIQRTKKINGSWKLYQGLQKTLKKVFILFLKIELKPHEPREMLVIKKFYSISCREVEANFLRPHQKCIKLTFFCFHDWREKRFVVWLIEMLMFVLVCKDRRLKAAGKMINQNWRIIRWNQRSLCQDYIQLPPVNLLLWADA